MITIIEDKLVDLIKSRLEEIKKEPRVLHSVFNLDSKEIDSLISAITRKPLTVQKMYPLHQAQLPCICVGLSGESESSSGIGDQIIDQGHQFDDLKPFSHKFISQEEGIVSFTDFGLVQSISKVSIGDEDYTLEVEVIDDFSIKINSIGEGVEVLVEGMIQDTYDVNIEGLYSTSYTIEIWTENADVTIRLYHLLKWILLSSRRYLIDIGLNKQSLSGGDFKPVPSFFPSFVYRRGITLKCDLFVAVPEYKGDLVNSIVVD